MGMEKEGAMNKLQECNMVIAATTPQVKIESNNRIMLDFTVHYRTFAV